MKGVLISNCETKHVLKCLENYTRVDGRAFEEFRELKIDFGRDWGCCFISLGQTKVLAQVSSEIQQPKSSRPNEGLLNINVELSPMGAPNFEAGRQSELSVHLNRMLEKCIKDSKAVDLESLCIKQNEKVWALRVDLNILNHEGNILDCASIAVLTALTHFKRPDVTSDGEFITIHTYEQRDPIPLTIHHYPVCVSYGTFNLGTILVADPSLLEEGVSEAQLIFGVNSFKEICTIHLGGSALINTNLIIEYGSRAAKRAITVVETMKDAVEIDRKFREEKQKNNEVPLFEEFIVSCFEKNAPENLSTYLENWSIKDSSKRKKSQKKTQNKMETNENEEKMIEKPEKVVDLGEGSAALLDQQSTVNQQFEDSDDSDVVILPTEPKIETVDIDDDSEEDDVIILNPTPSKKKKNKNKH